MKKIAAVVAAVVAAWLILKTAKNPSYANFPPTSGTTWVAFGDSLTSGAGATADQTYPAILGQRLGVKILNHGMPGNTTEDGLNRVDEIVRLNPKVVLLCLGGNDGLRSVPAEIMFRNLGAIVDRLHECGAFVVLIGVRSASLLNRNESGFKRLAKEKRTLYVPDILSGIIGNPGLMADQIHPNEEGNARIAEKIEAALQPVISELKFTNERD